MIDDELPNLESLVRGAFSPAPKRHSKRGDKCPSISKFVAGTHAWDSEEEAHIDNCSHCQWMIERAADIHAKREPEIEVAVTTDVRSTNEVDELRQRLEARDAEVAGMQRTLKELQGSVRARLEVPPESKTVLENQLPSGVQPRSRLVPYLIAALSIAFVCLGGMGGVAVSQASAISKLESRVDDLDRQLERSGVRTAMIGSVSASGRSTVRTQGSWDTRYLTGAVLRIGERRVTLKGRSTADPTRLAFDQTIVVPLDGQSFEAELVFQPGEGVYESLPTFFDEDRRVVRRRFLASRSGLITDPEEITISAEIDQLVNNRDYKDPTGSTFANRYVAAGQVYEPVVGKHGWLVIAPTLASNKYIGSRLSLDGSRFLARCYLGNEALDGQPYRIYCVFHDDKHALKVEEQILPDFDWEAEGFVVALSRYKINDGDDGFDVEPGRNECGISRSRDRPHIDSSTTPADKERS